MIKRLGIMAGTLLVCCQAYAQAPASTLPGGASAIEERFQDWRVVCGQQNAVKRCNFSQQQSQQNGQIVLNIELAIENQKTVTGNLVLPFGLALASGAALQIDDGELDSSLPFKTCLPFGCVVPLSFNAASLAVLRKGQALKINVVASADNKPVTLSVSLKGFAVALDRVAVLDK